MSCSGDRKEFYEANGYVGTEERWEMNRKERWAHHMKDSTRRRFLDLFSEEKAEPLVLSSQEPDGQLHGLESGSPWLDGGQMGGAGSGEEVASSS